MRYPKYDPDIFSDDGILNPYPHYKAIRDAGPVTQLSATDVAAVARYKDVLQVLGDHQSFISGEGVAINPTTNDVTKGITLASDQPSHTEKRRVLMRPLSPKAMAALHSRVTQEARDLVARMKDQGSFEAVSEFSAQLPLSITSNMVGLPTAGRERMLQWAAGTFNTMGPANALADRDFALGPELIGYMANLTRADVLEGSWADQLFAAVEADDISHDTALQLLVDYTAPALDTTIAATSQVLLQLGQNPDQWEKLKANPDLVRNTFDEAIRLESPIRGFTRLAANDVEISGVPVARGTRLLVLYGSANRDERHWNDPECFDIERPGGRKHAGFGYGIHQCAGQHLARLQVTTLLSEMITQIDKIAVKSPRYLLNNTLRVLSSLEVTFQ